MFKNFFLVGTFLSGRSHLGKHTIINYGIIMFFVFWVVWLMT